jgi:hypothetical protein
MSGLRRPDIRDPTKRQVRQRCGFGCVICGLPIYDYDHMVDYADVQEHTAENITLLCPNHHRDKSKGVLPLEVVQQANADPHNLRTGVSTPHMLHYSGGRATVVVGGNVNTATRSTAAITIDGLTIVGFQIEDGRCLLQANIYNRENEPVLRIVDNELTYDSGVWDVMYEGQTLTIREGAGQIFLEVVFEPPNLITIPRAEIVYNGLELSVRPDGGWSMCLMGARTR